MREEEGVEVPIEREGRWIVAEPGLQKRMAGGNEGSERGRDLGGVRTTPVRSLEAGAFRMEVWVEEGRGKFRVGVEDGEGNEADE